MARIGVFHPVSADGGGEAVCLNVVEALQETHTVEILTISGLEIARLNEMFGTDADPDTTQRRLGQWGAILDAGWGHVAEPLGIGRLAVSVFNRLVRRITTRYDLIFSTYGDFYFETPSVQYVHFPNFYHHQTKGDTRPLVQRIYDWSCRRAAGVSRSNVTKGAILVNSDWTGTVFEHAYQVTPRTVYPPVNTADLEPQPWDRRENGFVTVSRIVPDKHIELLIQIVTTLRRQGYDVHIHVVGESGDTEYYNRIQTIASRSDGIHLEGAVSRERLVELLCSHKYGLHGMRNEHFGMGIAEIVAAGAIPFVHDSGGQREVVGHIEQLLYDDEDAAVEKVRHVLENDSVQETLRRELPDVKTAFGTDRFQTEVATIVDERLAESSV